MRLISFMTKIRIYYIGLFAIFNIELNCGDPSSNLTISKMLLATGSLPTVTLYKTNLLISCATGYTWADNGMYQTINCTAQAIWTSSSLSCVCMLIGDFHEYE